MKGMISAKIIKRCGRRILKLFYKFSVSTNPIKFIDMELVDNDNMETMVTLYFQNQNSHIESIQLFVELADVEPPEDFTLLSEEHEVQNPCMEVPRVSVERQSTVRGFDIGLNTLPMLENLNSGPRLQIHPVVIETNADGEDGYDNNGHSNHEVEAYSDLYLHKVPNDIDDEGVNEDVNVYTSSIENLSRDIFIRNNLRAHMSIVNPDMAHAFKFLEYYNILPAHRLVTDLECEELFMGQKFTTKED
ncbi:hypothetical protein J1N35_037656 [Gossypium stocksii]|uniref:Uncharacterized protein n=1 Tax=Gossypium stocksii TaxID=47602 RepID=A0A9D3UKF3_9ROSI|nr:hypothetical protein J1N35_037656 [Gossypium stocksii]